MSMGDGGAPLHQPLHSNRSLCLDSAFLGTERALRLIVRERERRGVIGEGARARGRSRNSF